MNSAEDNQILIGTKHAPKKHYNTPTLSNYGTVVQQTLAGVMAPVSDAGMNMMAMSS